MERFILRTISDVTLKEIADREGGVVITSQMAVDEINRRDEVRHNPFKPYENKVYIKRTPNTIHAIKTKCYSMQDHGMNVEKIDITGRDEDINEASARMWDSFIESERDIYNYFKGYTETDMKTWDELCNMYNEIAYFINSSLENF